MIPLDLLQLVTAIALAVNTFGRLRKTTGSTMAPIRHAFALLFAMSLAAAGAPWVWSLRATWLSVGLLAAILLVQISTGYYWRAGVPRSFHQGTSS